LHAADEMEQGTNFMMAPVNFAKAASDGEGKARSIIMAASQLTDIRSAGKGVANLSKC
jgi:hypothetical protein